jgi:hypothetical protein
MQPRMTYGVDECRRCGKPMRARRDNPKADDTRPSGMTEAQWRAEGWLARPTRAQQQHPGIGCCSDCAALILRKRWKPGLRIGMMLSAIVVFAGLVWWLMELYVP